MWNLDGVPEYMRDVARMAAETMVIKEFGPDANIEDFQIDYLRVSLAGVEIEEKDGVTEFTPQLRAEVAISVRVDQQLDEVEISFKFDKEEEDEQG